MRQERQDDQVGEGSAEKENVNPKKRKGKELVQERETDLDGLLATIWGLPEGERIKVFKAMEARLPGAQEPVIIPGRATPARTPAEGATGQAIGGPAGEKSRPGSLTGG